MTSPWRDRIRDALGSGSEAQMQAVYRALIDDMGPEAGGRLWLEVISAWDHSAVTG
jgi:hypothetical protein